MTNDLLKLSCNQTLFVNELSELEAWKTKIGSNNLKIVQKITEHRRDINRNQTKTSLTWESSENSK